MREMACEAPGQKAETAPVAFAPVTFAPVELTKAESLIAEVFMPATSSVVPATKYRE